MRAAAFAKSILPYRLTPCWSLSVGVGTAAALTTPTCNFETSTPAATTRTAFTATSPTYTTQVRHPPKSKVMPTTAAHPTARTQFAFSRWHRVEPLVHMPPRLDAQATDHGGGGLGFPTGDTPVQPHPHLPRRRRSLSNKTEVIQQHNKTEEDMSGAHPTHT